MTGDPIFQPLQVGSLTLPNRVVMTTVKLGYATKNSEVTDRHVAFYARRAAGGVGLLATEPLYVQENGRELPTQMGIHHDGLVGGLAELVGAVHGAGGRIMAHINHAGRAANPRLVAEPDRISASEVPCPANQVVPRPLNTEEIAAVVRAFGEAARRASEAGFDAMEVPFEEIRIPVGTVVLAVGVRPNRQLFDELEGSDLEVHVVGDAVEPRGIGEAIREGLEAALAL